VDAAPGFLGLGDHFDHLFEFSDRATVRHGFAASGLDFFNNLECGIGMAGAVAAAAQIVDDNLGAACSEFERIGAAKAAAKFKYIINILFYLFKTKFTFWKKKALSGTLALLFH